MASLIIIIIIISSIITMCISFISIIIVVNALTFNGINSNLMMVPTAPKFTDGTSSISSARPAE